MHPSIDFGDLPFSMCLARRLSETLTFSLDIRLKWCSIDIVRATCCARPSLRHSAVRFKSLLSLLASQSRIAPYSRGVPLATLALSWAEERLIVLSSGCHCCTFSCQATTIYTYPADLRCLARTPGLYACWPVALKPYLPGTFFSGRYSRIVSSSVVSIAE